MSDVDVINYDIHVTAETRYIAAESDPDNNHYVFAYTVHIQNNGNIGAKLISRHWIITDADNQTQEVKGEGVVGEQPYLQVGESFTYTSGTMIETPVGTMHGSYQMAANDGHQFDALIEPFTLAMPRILN